MPSSASSQSTSRAQDVRQEWRDARARHAARACGVFGVAPVDGKALSERKVCLLVMLLPLLLFLLF